MTKRKPGEKQSLLVESSSDDNIASGHVAMLLAQGLKTTPWGTVSRYLFHATTAVFAITYLVLVIGYYANCQVFWLHSLPVTDFISHTMLLHLPSPF
jgi:hypothetical protein